MKNAARRPSQLDFVVMALAPALIMTLVGSLSFLLISVFYNGPHLVRLNWVMFWFVVGIVLIARISIEIDGERAAVYGLALAGAVALVSMKLVGSPMLVWFLLALVWWCAHQLTLDCTLIDDSEDASGEGLMQIVGLDRPPAELQRPASPGPRSGFWRRLFLGRRPGEPHAPGLWVVYFSLAALPLFGISQMFIPASDERGRAFAFWCMCVYVASALGLLAVTSLLGLRRYLRQRGLAMPVQMTGVWLTAAAVVVSALLVVGSLLPRPGASWFAMRWSVAQGPRQPASQHAVVREGTGEGAGAAGQERLGVGQQAPPAVAGNGPAERGEGGGSGVQTEQQTFQASPAEQVQSNGKATQQDLAGGQAGEADGAEQASRGSHDLDRGPLATEPASAQGQAGRGPQQQNGNPLAGEQRADRPVPADQTGPGQQGGTAAHEGAAKDHRPAEQGGRHQQGSNSERGGTERASGTGQHSVPGSRRGGQETSSGQQSQEEMAQDATGRGMPRSGTAPSQGTQSGEQDDRPEEQSSGENAPPSSGIGQASSRRGSGGQPPQSEKGPTAVTGGQGVSGAAQETAPQDRQVGTSGGHPRRPSVGFAALAKILKWLVYAALAAAGVFLLLRHWRGLVCSLTQLVTELANFLERMLGRDRQHVAAPAGPPAPPPRPFAHFANPFVTGEAAKSSPRHLLIYTYAALQAWAEERGMPPHCAQTPMEFAERLGLQQPHVADEAAQLALVYSHLVYGRREPDAAVHSLLRRVWERLSQPAELTLVGGKGEG